jgi:hypothetical protein
MTKIITRIAVWWTIHIMRPKKPIKNTNLIHDLAWSVMQKERDPIIILEQGNLQVIAFELPAINLFWVDTKVQVRCGPFPSILEACQHYTWWNKQQAQIPNIIQVDFKRRKRI